MALAHARLMNVSSPQMRPVYVQFNPTEYGIDGGASYAEVQVPGLQTPLLQFVRGEMETLNLELFLDSTDTRGSENANDELADRLERIRSFVRIDGKLHAPPVCRFEWGRLQFQGVVTSLREKFTLFDERGDVMRARVTLALKKYEAVEVQLRKLKLSSPDRTHVRVVRQGETLARIAEEVYGNARLWRFIAEANGIDRPRFLAPGTTLRIPAL